MKSSDWIKVEDRLPEHNQVILVCNKWGQHFVVKYNAVADKWFSEDGEWGYYNITHWMPIVSPNNDCKGMDSKLSPLAKPCPNFTPKED